MSTKERIFHTILFEIIALSIIIGASQLPIGDAPFLQENPAVIGGLALSLSLIAMVWNYVYNLGFDKFFGANRISRSVLKRIGHGFGFEVGLLTVTLPWLMWALRLDFWTVLILDLGLAAFFLVYSIVYNWSYDNVREKFKSSLPITA